MNSAVLDMLDDESERAHRGKWTPRFVSAEIDEIATQVGERLGVDPDALLGKTRRRPVQRARHIAIHVARYRLGWSLPKLGKHFGRDHSTILDSLRVADRLLATDREVAELVRGLLEGPRRRVAVIHTPGQPPHNLKPDPESTPDGGAQPAESIRTAVSAITARDDGVSGACSNQAQEDNAR